MCVRALVSGSTRPSNPVCRSTSTVGKFCTRYFFVGSRFVTTYQVRLLLSSVRVPKITRSTRSPNPGRPPRKQDYLLVRLSFSFWCDVTDFRFFFFVGWLFFLCVSCFCVFAVPLPVAAPPPFRRGGTRAGVLSSPWWQTMTSACTLSWKTWGFFLTSTSSSPAAR